jgi:hypothetical protein
MFLLGVFLAEIAGWVCVLLSNERDFRMKENKYDGWML